MPDQLTGPALDRAACEALGIEPKEWVAKAPYKEPVVFEYKRYLMADEYADQNPGTKISPVYPRVSTWEAVRLLVERVVWERTFLGVVDVWRRGETHGCGMGPFPEALARAVVAWKEASK